MNEINFDIIKNEQSVDELFRMKIELTDETSDLHTSLHDHNSAKSKPELLKEINYNNELIEYLNNRIKDRKQEIYISEKEDKNRLKKFKDVARMLLPAEIFSKIQSESFK